MRLVNLHGPNNFSIDEVNAPEITERDVLVEVHHCGICGSDVGYVAAGGLMGPGSEPMPLGHELSGIVVEVGEAVSGVELGDRVCVNPMGANNAIGNGGSEGGFAPHLVVRNAAEGGCIYKLPDSVSMSDGALVEPLSVGMHAVNMATPQVGQNALVFGLGAIGLSCIVALRHHGVHNIIGLDFSAERRERALNIGASSVFSPDGLNLLATLQEAHGEQQVLGMLPAAGTDIFIDAAGAPTIVKSVLDVCKSNAKLVVAGLHKKPVDVDFTMLLSKELSIIGSMAYPIEFPQVLDMLSSGKYDLSPLISHHFPLEQFDDAFQLASSPEAGAKIMIDLPACAR